MTLALIFGAVLLTAVLLSELSRRSILSSAVLFLVVGIAVGRGGIGLVGIRPNHPIVSTLAGLALFSILFTDGMKLGIKELGAVWALPGRALILGMPLTFGMMSAAAHLFAGFGWAESFLIAAILTPTDPVFAAAIVGRHDVPKRLRDLLNIESGLNDGLALPVVVILLAVVGGRHTSIGREGLDLLIGVAIGILLPLVAIKLERLPVLAAERNYEPLYAFAIGVLVLAVTSVTGSNQFLGGFAAGVTVATIGKELKESFERFGELVAELFKLAAVLVFGTLFSLEFFSSAGVGTYLFILAALFVARPLSILLSLIGTQVDRKQRLAAAWFGPKGFASIVYGLLVLRSGVSSAESIFQVVALSVVISIVAHSSTDVLVARRFDATSA